MPSAGWSLEKAGHVIQSKSEGWRTRGVPGVRTCPDPKAREPGAKTSRGQRWRSQLHQRKQIHPSSTFCSIQALSGWDAAHLPWEGSSLLSLQILMIMCSGNIFLDTPRSNLLPAARALSGPVKVTHTINSPRDVSRRNLDT